ncbi:integrase core domain protein [Trichuris suis]|nr:integrase core domain protein [Trichuris suis]
MDSDEKEISTCECCIRGKLNQWPFPISKSRVSKPLELIHSDVCGPMQTATPSGNRYCLTMIDDYSRFTVAGLLKHNGQVPKAIQEILREWSTQFGRRAKALRTDNGKEYVTNEQLLKFLKREGIKHQTTLAYTPQQNGVAERRNRSLQEMAKCMLLDANIPTSFWGEEMLAAAYLQNRLPSRSVSRTPKELWDGKKPDVSHIRIFGSKSLTLVPKQLHKKWDDKAEEGVLVGYGETSKGYRVLDVASNKVRISRVVKFIEPQPPGKTNRYLVPEGEASDESEVDAPQLLPTTFPPDESPVITEDSLQAATEEPQIRNATVHENRQTWIKCASCRYENVGTG